MAPPSSFTPDFAKQDEKAAQVWTDLLEIHHNFKRLVFGFVSCISQAFLIWNRNIFINVFFFKVNPLFRIALLK